MRKSIWKKALSLLCALTLVLGLLPVQTLAAESGPWINGDGIILCDTYDTAPPVSPADYSGNLLQNPGFEDGMAGWSVTNGQWQGNNPHSGSGHFGLNWTNSMLVQTVVAPYTGRYQNYGYFVAGASGGRYGVRMEGSDAALEEQALPARTVYGDPDTLPDIELKQGDRVEVYCGGGAGWVNGDDFFLGYDFAHIGGNLLAGTALTEGAAVRLPWAGDYRFSAEIAAEEDTTVTVGGESDTVAAGETRTVTLALTAQALNAMVEISIDGVYGIRDASLTLDVSGIENAPPTAANVTAEGTPMTGLRLLGTYAFEDNDPGLAGWEGATALRWLCADAEDGDYTPIDGATGRLLLLSDALDGKYVRLEVTPVDVLGAAGDPVRSNAVGPIVRNYIGNSSLDIQINNNPVGWAVKNGGALGNNKAKAHTDLRYVDLPAGDADAEAYCAVTVPENAHYRVGAWVNTASEAGALGVRTKSGIVLGSIPLPNTEEEYVFVELGGIALERNIEVEAFIVGGQGSEGIWADDFQLVYEDAEQVPPFTNLHSFGVKGQTELVMDSAERTIRFFVPYGTDVTALEITAVASEGAAITPASGSKVNFTDPVELVITNGDAEATWTVICMVDDQRIALKSDNEVLQDGFNWAARKLNQFVMTGQSGPVNDDEFGDGTGPVEYMPSYWAGYYDRSAFYSRDFVHQAVGGQIAGLWDENWNMFYTFAENATAERKWYAPWAFNFDGSIFELDYNSPDSFVREVPAQFELVEKAYKQYLWSGDERYITDPVMWNFYTKAMTDFVTLHDSNGNGIAEGTGGGIFEGSCTYNELPGESAIEAGDAIGSQYQATLAYAAMLKEKGRIEENGAYTSASEEWYAKAAELKRYFNEEWSVKSPSQPDGQYVRTLGKDGTKYDGFGHENSWFIPMKLLTEPGARNDAYLDYIETMMGDYIGQNPGIHTNVEAWSYLPDTYFPYNQNDTAWKYMKYILSIKDLPHQRPSQGTNGDYPEISFTVISHTIEGMMGMEADAGNHKLVTAPRLPSDVGYVEASYIQMGDRANGGHILNLTHDGLAKTTLANDSDHALTWEARFYGSFDYVEVGGKREAAAHKDVNGVQVSYVVTEVPAGGTVTARAVSYAPEAPSGGSDKGSNVEKNPDGSTTATVTDPKTGTVTETTTWPDGKQVETATTTTGDKTMTVTDKDGNIAAVLHLPGQPPVSDKQFDDIGSYHWAEDAIALTVGLGLFQGTGGNAFSPAHTMSRGMLVTSLHRLSGEVAGGEAAFEDVESGAWYADAVAWATQTGIVEGNDGRFSPNDSVTREQLAAMLYRYAALLGCDTKNGSSALDGYSDADTVSTWARDAMAWAVENGILTGKGGGTLDASGAATRAEAAVMLQRFISYLTNG